MVSVLQSPVKSMQFPVMRRRTTYGNHHCFRCVF